MFWSRSRCEAAHRQVLHLEEILDAVFGAFAADAGFLEAAEGGDFGRDDAQGYRVGILANSDGHKGRHGASHPGASLFGAYGGLSCLLAPDLTRAGLFEALRRRHHYATTGCRTLLNVEAVFDRDSTLFADDPSLGPTAETTARTAMMGDILRTDARDVALHIEAEAPAPIERMEIRNGKDVLEVWRPYSEDALGRRIRIIWEGSEYRGRGRQTVWDGRCMLSGNAFERITPINLWNLNKKLELQAQDAVVWTALTTGGFGGFDAWLDDPRAGTLRIDTALVQCEIPIESIGLEDLSFVAGGIERRIRVFRLPDENAGQSSSTSYGVRPWRHRFGSGEAAVRTSSSARATSFGAPETWWTPQSTANRARRKCCRCH